MLRSDRLSGMNNYQSILAMAFNFNDPSQQPNSMDSAGASPKSTSRDSAGNSAPSLSSRNVTVYQTTGPDAHTSPMQSSDGSGAPALNPRSCVTCRRRKVRCDKQMPCSNCRRAQIPCVFPAPGRAPRQPRPRDPNAPPKNSSHREMELMKRLRKLEGIVEELSGQIEVESGGKAASSQGSPEAAFTTPGGGTERATSVAQRQMSATSMFGPASGSAKDTESVSDHSETARKRDLQQQFGRLVLNDHKGSTRYVSSGFWARLNEELDSIREESQKLTDEDSVGSELEESAESSPISSMQTDHHAFILGYRSADVDLKKCHPLPSHVPFLWSVYQENVEPLIKMLHVPSMESIIRNARKFHEKLTPGQVALVFTIYYGAITSLEPDEVQSHLGAKKDDLLTQYRFAVEQALAKANYLNTSDMAVVQAFVIYLMIVRRNDDSRFCWSLTGLLIHIAQGMGLHRDGSHFNLSPFETEMRRRVWWGLLILDLRSAEELGSDLIVSEFTYDTQMPSNIDDADISPTTVEFPEPKEGRSDTAVAIVRYEICGLARRLVRASSAAVTMCPKAGEMSLADRESMLVDVYERIETRFLHHVIDETDALYWVAAMISRVIMAKMCIVIYQPMLFPGTDQQMSNDIRHRVYIASVEIMEYCHILNTDRRCRQFRWLFMTYTNWHAIAYALIETCRRPWTPLVERGWEALNGYETHPVENARHSDHTAVFVPLRKLFIKARKHRSTELARLRANPDEARRLDYQERNTPSKARFAPIPGQENRMEQARAKWYMLLQSSGTAPTPQADPQQPLPANNVLHSDQFTSAISQQQVPRAQTPSAGQIPTQLDLSDAAMGLVDDIMSQNEAFPVSAFWPLNDMVSTDPDTGAVIGNSTGIDNPTTVSTTSQNIQSNGFSQGMMPESDLPKDDHLPPYLWSNIWGHSEPKLDNGEDIDMLGEGFNWQDWSQNIRGLEMDGAQGQNTW